jgi:CBS-domain-containing membrane protein
MTRVQDVMTRDVVTVGEATPYKRVVELLHEHGVSALPVVDADGVLLGLVSEADLLAKLEFPAGWRDATLAAAARRLLHGRIRRLMVTDAHNHLIGIVSRSDLLRVFLRPDEEIRRELLDVLGSQTVTGPFRFTVAVRDGVATVVGQPRRVGS